MAGCTHPEISRSVLVKATYVEHINIVTCYSPLYLPTPALLLRDNRCLQRDNRLRRVAPRDRVFASSEALMKAKLSCSVPHCSQSGALRGRVVNDGYFRMWCVRKYRNKIRIFFAGAIILFSKFLPSGENICDPNWSNNKRKKKLNAIYVEM